MITLKTEAEIALMREAGLIVAAAIAATVDAVAPGVSTADLDKVAEDVIRGAGAIPSFVGYRGFPATLCTSVNDEVVHGIPSPSRVLRAGDLVSIDCGAIVGGLHGDSAVTVPVGEVPETYLELLRVCEDSLWAGLAAARTGGRLGDISASVEAAVRPSGFGIVEDYGGHGIGHALHEDPHILNYGRAGRGVKLEHGLVLAIEPMINLGEPDTKVLDDDWTVVTVDGTVSAHFEHTVAITPNGPWVLTAEDGGTARFAAMGLTAAAR